MNLERFEKLNPWNWFKHEDDVSLRDRSLPVKRDDTGSPYDNHPVLQLHQEIDRLFNDAFANFSRGFSPASWPTQTGTRFNPELDISSDENEYAIKLEAAGLSDKDIALELKDRKLVISGEKREDNEEKDKHFYRVERRYGAFQRVLDLPDDAVTSDINASMTDGVLSVRIPRDTSQKEPGQHIEIQTRR